MNITCVTGHIITVLFALDSLPRLPLVRIIVNVASRGPAALNRAIPQLEN